MLLRYPRRAAKVLIYLAAVLCVLHFLDLLNFFTRRYDTWPWTTCPDSSLFEQSCQIPRATIARDTQIVLRTGGSEALRRIRSHLGTVLSEVPPQNVLVLSDMEETLGDYHAYNVYADISAHERAQYPEFALYDEQQQLKQQGKDTRELQGGWKLGKYMNLPMKRKIWNLQQNNNGEGALARKKWFVFIETDTFVEWDNLFELLEHLDPAEKVYIGSPVWLPGLQFAHGGSGYILSYAALSALNAPSTKDQDSPFYSQFDVNVTALCCGDEALARALKSRGVTLKGYWPSFNGEVPVTVAFGRDLWCEPVLSLHHISGADLEGLWRWVEAWKVRTRSMQPFLFKDLFDHIAPQLVGTRVDWDNNDDDWKIYPAEGVTYTNFEMCQAACDADKLCFQFVYYGTKCAISHHIRLGRRREPGDEGGVHYISGWNMERIRYWTRKTRCASAHWVRSNP